MIFLARFKNADNSENSRLTVRQMITCLNINLIISSMRVDEDQPLSILTEINILSFKLICYLARSLLLIL